MNTSRITVGPDSGSAAWQQTGYALSDSKHRQMPRMRMLQPKHKVLQAAWSPIIIGHFNFPKTVLLKSA